MEKFVEFVKNYALDHYEDGGWDVIVECWEDEQIAEQLKGAETPEEALELMASPVSIYKDYQDDARNSAF